MLLIQQSASFRAWTSRALMVYFRRALLFLVVSPRQNIKYFLLQQEQKVYFSDAEDDNEEILMIDDKRRLIDLLFDRNKNNSNRIQISQSKQYLLKEYVFKKIFQGLNNSMNKSIDELSSNQSTTIFDSIQPSGTEEFELSISNSFSIKTINNTKICENKVSDDFVYQYQSNPSCNQINTLPPYDPYINSTDPVLSYPVSHIYKKKSLHFNLQTCPSCLPLFSMSDSVDNKTPSFESDKSSLLKSFTKHSSTSIEQNLSQSSDDEDDIYEKYQTSFSYILHQTKSLNTIRKEDKLQSMLVLQPNTSIITVRLLTYHSLSLDNINYPMITSHICVRLIANRTDLSIQCDTKPIGCKKSSFNDINKSTSINTEQQKNLIPTSILVDIPYKTLYIDS